MTPLQTRFWTYQLEVVIGVMVMEVNKVADEVTDMEVDKVADMKIPK